MFKGSTDKSCRVNNTFSRVARFTLLNTSGLPSRFCRVENPAKPRKLVFLALNNLAKFLWWATSSIRSSSIIPSVDIALFKGVRYSESALHPTVPHTSVPHSNENRYKQQLLNLVELLIAELQQPATLPKNIAMATTQQASVFIVSQDKAFVEQINTELSSLTEQMNKSRCHFLIESATDLDAARSAIAQSTWNVILLDLSGIKIAQHGLAFLQNLGQQFPTIPVLVLTQGNNLAERVEAIRLGGRVVLEKPVLPGQLYEILHQILNQKQPITSKVLVVDDDLAILARVKHMLEPWGILVQTLQDPPQFLQALNSFMPDLLILDMEMPQFNGIDLCQVVRNDPTWRNLPVLFLTLHHEVELLYRAFAAGADDYIHKPIVESELVTRVVSRLDRLRLLQR
jgi:DNA-binding response OmpR family regulator